MIIGGHSVIHSTDAEGDRAFFRDVLEFPNVDARDGWLIFALPPSEFAIHPASKNDLHEFYLMCDDAEAFVTEMAEKGVECTPAQNVGWGGSYQDYFAWRRNGRRLRAAASPAGEYMTV